MVTNNTANLLRLSLAVCWWQKWWCDPRIVSWLPSLLRQLVIRRNGYRTSILLVKRWFHAIYPKIGAGKGPLRWEIGGLPAEWIPGLQRSIGQVVSCSENSIAEPYLDMVILWYGYHEDGISQRVDERSRGGMSEWDWKAVHTRCSYVSM